MDRRQREQTAVVEGTIPKQDTLDRRAELRRAVIGFSLGALALLVAAPFLAWVRGANRRRDRHQRNVYRHVVGCHHDLLARVSDVCCGGPVGRVRSCRGKPVRE